MIEVPPTRIVQRVDLLHPYASLQVSGALEGVGKKDIHRRDRRDRTEQLCTRACITTSCLGFQRTTS